MFILKFFGIMDLYSALIMLLVQFGVTPWRIILTAAAWLILKGILFKGDMASMIDLGIGVYHLLMFFLPIPLVTYVLAIYLIIKGSMSILS